MEHSSPLPGQLCLDSNPLKLSENSKKRLGHLVKNFAGSVCSQLEKHQERQVITVDGKQSLTSLLLDSDSTEVVIGSKQLAYVAGNLFFCLQEYLDSYRSSKLYSEKNFLESDCFSSCERVSSELKNLLFYLQRNYDAKHKNELYYIFSLKLVRVLNLYLLSKLLQLTRSYSQVYQSFWNCLDEEIESCLKVGALPSIVVDVASNSAEKNEARTVSISWHRILQEALDSIGKFLSSNKQGKELIKDKVQTTVSLVLRIATRIDSICSSSHSIWDLKTCFDSLEAQRSSSNSEWIDSDDQCKSKETFRTQLKALVLFQQLASEFGHEFVSIWNIIFPHGTRDMESDCLTGLLMYSPYPRIRLVSAKCISEVVSCGKNFLTRMIVASWKSTDRVALPREVQHIMLNIHRTLCFALSKEQHSSVLPAIVRCVSILFKVFPYHLLGTTTRLELQRLHKDIFIVFKRIVSILIDILKRERTDDTTYSAIVSSFGNLLSIPFQYHLYETKDMILESHELLNLIIGNEGILSTLIDRRNKHFSSGSLLADTYSALCQVSGCYFSTIFDKMMESPGWKQEMVDSLLYPSKNEALQVLIMKFIHSLMKVLFQDGDQQDALFEHCTRVTREQVTDFWCFITKQLFVTDISHLRSNAISLILSFIAMVPSNLVQQSSSNVLLHRQMFTFIEKYLLQGNDASVRGAATLAFIRATQISIQYNDVPQNLGEVVEITIHSILEEDVEWTFFSKATEALVELIKLVQDDDPHNCCLKGVGKYLFKRGEEVAYRALDIFQSRLVFRISIVRLLGSLVSFHDSDDRCFFIEYPDIGSKVIELLCNILDNQKVSNGRLLSETKLVWNACYSLSWITLHCQHDKKMMTVCQRETIFRHVFHRLQEEEVSHGNIKVLLACVRVLLCCLDVPVESTHKQYVEYLRIKVSSGSKETKQLERKWSLLLEQLEKLERLWK